MPVKPKKSFTIVETIVAIFIFSLILVSLFGGIFFLYRTHGYEWQQSMAVFEARRGIEKMVKEIREARNGENGAYPIEYAGDKEFIFYSDVDNDGKTEMVRYFLGEIQVDLSSSTCETFQRGGTCSVSFFQFLRGTLNNATAKIWVKGDLGRSNEYLEIFADGQKIGQMCTQGCTTCSNNWEGGVAFDVTSFARDNTISISLKASNRVDPICPHAFQALIEFQTTQEVQGTTLKRGVVKPSGSPPQYLKQNESVSIISQFVRNTPPIFGYYDKNGNQILEYPARLNDTKMMSIFLVINVDPNLPPEEYQLRSFVTLRNLKTK